jgi:hypothetical protein
MSLSYRQENQLRRIEAAAVPIPGCRVRGIAGQAPIHRSGRGTGAQQRAGWDQESGMC